MSGGVTARVMDFPRKFHIFVWLAFVSAQVNLINISQDFTVVKQMFGDALAVACVLSIYVYFLITSQAIIKVGIYYNEQLTAFFFCQLGVSR